MQHEEWRPVQDWPEYEVSSLGRLRRTKAAQGTSAGRVLSPHLNESGYAVATLRRPGEYRHTLVHILVCEAFHGPQPTPQHEVAHNDGIAGNIAEDNLRWATPVENAADRVLHGTHNRGERSPLAKLTAKAVAEIRAIPPRQVDLAALAARYGVAVSTVKGARYGQKWKHEGVTI